MRGRHDWPIGPRIPEAGSDAPIVLPTIVEAKGDGLFECRVDTGEDVLDELWRLQFEQQRELGLDPETLSDVERRRQHTDLVTQLHEEASELGRAVGGYKRHVLRAPAVERYAVAIECVDVVKCALATAQLHGVDARMFASLFRAKTREISAKHAAERHTFGEILATDLDDVVADLEPWLQELGITTLSERGGPAERLRASESMKEQFYAGGRFRELAPIPGAPEALRRAKAAGFSIVIITARPQWQYKRLQSDTHDWLRAHDIPPEQS